MTIHTGPHHMGSAQIEVDGRWLGCTMRTTGGDPQIENPMPLGMTGWESPRPLRGNFELDGPKRILPTGRYRVRAGTAEWELALAADSDGRGFSGLLSPI